MNDQAEFQKLVLRGLVLIALRMHSPGVDRTEIYKFKDDVDKYTAIHCPDGVEDNERDIHSQ